MPGRSTRHFRDGIAGLHPICPDCGGRYEYGAVGVVPVGTLST